MHACERGRNEWTFWYPGITESFDKKRMRSWINLQLSSLSHMERPFEILITPYALCAAFVEILRNGEIETNRCENNNNKIFYCIVWVIFALTGMHAHMGWSYLCPNSFSYASFWNSFPIRILFLIFSSYESIFFYWKIILNCNNCSKFIKGRQSYLEN